MIPERDEPAWRAYEQSGFTLATEVLKLEVALDTPPPEASLPPDVTLRTYDDANACAVHKLLDSAYMRWDKTYCRSSTTTGSRSEHDGFDPAYWFLAETDGELVGVCLTWKEGWIKDLAVAPAAQGRGLGDALLRHAFGRLYERGVRRIGLKVDAHNPTSAIHLYEGLDMRVVERYRHYVKKL